jgi:predicted membrane channel-forming protein YqfA (hemolysin III family)
MKRARNWFATALSVVVTVIVVIGVLGIWEIIDWNILKNFFWKSVQSLFVMLIGGVVIYLIYALLYQDESPNGSGPSN